MCVRYSRLSIHLWLSLSLSLSHTHTHTHTGRIDFLHALVGSKHGNATQCTIAIAITIAITITITGNQPLRGKLNDPRANDPRKGLAAAGASGTARLFWKINAESYGTVRRVGETETETVPADHGEGGPRGPAVAAGIRGAGGRSGPVGSEQHAGRIAIAIAGSSDNNDNDNDSRDGS